MQEMYLNAENLGITLDKTEIVKNINLSIESGKIVGLIGPSGAGKTTIIKAIIGVYVPNKGTLTIFNEKMPSLKPLQNIGYMAQTDALYEDLTAYQNLLFFGSLYGLAKKELQTRCDEVLNLTHLSEDKNKIVRKYSGGMKRRLSMAISFLHSPKLLILDEPTVGLDPTLRLEFKELFKELAKKGQAILMTTHVMDEVNDCDFLYMLREGKVIASGSPTQLIGNFSNLEDAFIHYCSSEMEVPKWELLP